MATTLTESQIADALPTVPGWSLESRDIHRTFDFPDFAAAMVFVNGVATLAEHVNHHPDIDIRWNKVTLRLSTHSAGGLTALDFDLAKRIGALAA